MPFRLSRYVNWLFALLSAISLLHSQRILADDQWFADYAKHVEQEANKYNVPGYAMVFYQQGKAPVIVVYGKTHANGDAVTPDTVFRLASVSKTFTAVLMAKMVRQHQLEWNTPVVSLSTTLQSQGTMNPNLTLGHIVGQSSGYMPNAYDNLIEANYPLKRVLGQLAGLKPLCEPGECYTYQNALFGVIEEYFTGNNTSYHRQLREQLLYPLGMETASAGKGGLLASEEWARPHIAIARNRWREGQVESNYYRFSPAAGVNASIKDMTRWLQAMLVEFPTVVPEDVIADVTTPRVKTSREVYRRGWRDNLTDAHYGFGWRIYDYAGETLNYHGGWVKGYRADVSFSPKYRAGYVMLMNAESNLINTTTADFWRTYFQEAKRKQQAPASTANE
ncbi:serine hydrolase domain-containing protein [Aestuariibacter sp. GS-14]|uniref:serine hydrolase domain-containing protein n=1 Tax=Aestuariibacter sp. GS-14 TaxID=2590670 RepID=UPI0035119110